MQYSFVSAAILASISSVLAQTAGFDAMSIPTDGQVVQIGDVLDITWAPNSVSGTVTIKLLEGATPSTLNYDPIVVASSVDNLAGSYSWTIPSTVGSFATYGIEIRLDSDSSTYQWSYPFVIDAAATTSSSSSIVASTTSVASSASSAVSTVSSAVSSISSAATTVAHSSFITSTSAVSPVTTAYVAPSTNKTVANSTSTYTAPSNVTLSTTHSSATASKTGGVATATGNAAVSNVVTGSFAMLGGLLAAFML